MYIYGNLALPYNICRNYLLTRNKTKLRERERNTRFRKPGMVC